MLRELLLPLPLVCAACSAVLPVDARFCDACGQPVHVAADATANSATATPEPRAYTPSHLAAKILTALVPIYAVVFFIVLMAIPSLLHWDGRYVR